MPEHHVELMETNRRPHSMMVDRNSLLVSRGVLGTSRTAVLELPEPGRPSDALRHSVHQPVKRPEAIRRSPGRMPSIQAAVQTTAPWEEEANGAAPEAGAAICGTAPAPKPEVGMDPALSNSTQGKLQQ